MEVPRRLAIACLVCALTFLCQGLDSNGKASEKNIRSPSNGFGSLTSLTPWGSPSSFSGASNQGLQDWRQLVKKRNFGSGFHIPGTGHLATWKSWMNKKRNFRDGAFTNLGQLDNGQFQSWTDYIKKRGLHSAFGESGNPFDGGFQRLNLQSWKDMVKRGAFGSDFHNIGGGTDQLQSWNDWVKRSFGASSETPFGNGFGDKAGLQSWMDMYKRAVEDKRQFNSKPAAFGAFGSHFTNGLQDWRASFPAGKRAQDDDDVDEKQDKN